MKTVIMGVVMMYVGDTTTIVGIGNGSGTLNNSIEVVQVYTAQGAVVANAAGNDTVVIQRADTFYEYPVIVR